MQTTVNIYDAKARLSKLIAQVAGTGKPIVICRNGTPVADLVPHVAHTDPLRQHPGLKGAVYHGDPCASVSEVDWPKESR